MSLKAVITLGTALAWTDEILNRCERNFHSAFLTSKDAGLILIFAWPSEFCKPDYH